VAGQRFEGQYRTQPTGDREAMVYVRGGAAPSYMTEATYRAKGYRPSFEKLPTEEEYDSRGL
jgi:hypothetical protein